MFICELENNYKEIILFDFVFEILVNFFFYIFMEDCGDGNVFVVMLIFIIWYIVFVNIVLE